MKEILMIGISRIGGGKEKETLKILRENARAVVNTVKKFEEMINALFSERDVERAQTLGRQVSALETKADTGRRKFASYLSKGAFLPAFRGDLARLAEQVDNVADAAEGVTRTVLLREKLLNTLVKAEKRERKAKVIREGLIKIAGLATQTVEALKSSIDSLASNIDAATARANEADKLEHASDIMEQSLLADVFAYEKLLDPVSVLQLNNIIHGIGDISDRAEDASDVISIVAYTLRA